MVVRMVEWWRKWCDKDGNERLNGGKFEWLINKTVGWFTDWQQRITDRKSPCSCDHQDAEMLMFGRSQMERPTFCYTPIYLLYFRRFFVYTSKYDNTDSTHSNSHNADGVWAHRNNQALLTSYREPENSSRFVFFFSWQFCSSAAPLACFSRDNRTYKNKSKQHWSYFNDYVLYYCYKYRCHLMFSFEFLFNNLFCLSNESNAKLWLHELTRTLPSFSEETLVRCFWCILKNVFVDVRWILAKGEEGSDATVTLNILLAQRQWLYWRCSQRWNLWLLISSQFLQ